LNISATYYPNRSL